jgi:hypothetical protein
MASHTDNSECDALARDTRGMRYEHRRTTACPSELIDIYGYNFDSCFGQNVSYKMISMIVFIFYFLKCQVFN